MTITQIRCFIEVADCLSFTEASRRLFVSQQAVSNQIRNLEQEIGIPLFSRSTKQVALTEGGKLLYKEWKEMLHRADESLETARKIHGISRRKIRIGIAEVSGIIDVVSKALVSYSDQYPDVELETEIRSFTQLEELLQGKESDVIITLATELTKYQGAYETRQLFELQLGIVLSARHPLAGRETLCMSDVKEETIYMLSSSYSSEAEEFIIAHCRKEGFEPKMIKFFHSMESMELALHTGRGVSVGYNIFFRNTEKQLRFYPIEGYIRQYLVAAWNKESPTDFSVLLDHITPM